MEDAFDYQSILPHKTPCFIYHEKILLKKITTLLSLKEKTDCNLFYSVKAMSEAHLLKQVSSHMDGFSVSSLFEAKLCNLLGAKKIFYVSPCIKEHEADEIFKLCSYVTFNSIHQLKKFYPQIPDHLSIGLRIDPEISFVKDQKYDPCRKESKLGIPLKELSLFLKQNKQLDKIKGLHFHNNCESEDFSELYQTSLKIESYLKDQLSLFSWINLGGGYFFDHTDKKDFFKSLDLFKRYNCKTIIEPGAYLVRQSYDLISSVLDIITKNKKQIAILDTSVNHLPEIFEYGYKPEILNHKDHYKHSYSLQGASCLAGDIFGDYKFKEKLKLKDKIVFKNTGSYSLVKAQRFNGINLPCIYKCDLNNKLSLLKEYSFEDYLSFWSFSEDNLRHVACKDPYADLHHKQKTERYLLEE